VKLGVNDGPTGSIGLDPGDVIIVVLQIRHLKIQRFKAMETEKKRKTERVSYMYIRVCARRLLICIKRRAATLRRVWSLIVPNLEF